MELECGAFRPVLGSLMLVSDTFWCRFRRPTTNAVRLFFFFFFFRTYVPYNYNARELGAGRRKRPAVRAVPAAAEAAGT